LHGAESCGQNSATLRKTHAQDLDKCLKRAVRTATITTLAQDS